MVYGILAAITFGISAPLSKLLLADVDPIILAGLLYLGAGSSLGLLLLLSDGHRRHTREAHLSKSDWPWLMGAIVSGGVVGPIFLLLGLQRTPAATGSLLLNLEVVATGVIAALLFRESIGKRAWIAILAVSGGGALLAVDPSAAWGISSGAVLILAACIAWGVDNNLTGRISLKDPNRIVTIKGLVAGAFSLSFALALGRPVPPLVQTLFALGLGVISYGTSIALFVHSLRRVGAARTGALFGLAPFVGVALSFAVYRQWPQLPFFLALSLMVLATVLLARETHSHLHVHTPVTHAHRHRHDDGHHDHAHPDEDVRTANAHAHRHVHELVKHDHNHLPDPHHRHGHMP